MPTEAQKNWPREHYRRALEGVNIAERKRLLTERQLRAFEMWFEQGCGKDEVVREIGVSMATVSGELITARETLLGRTRVAILDEHKEPIKPDRPFVPVDYYDNETPPKVAELIDEPDIIDVLRCQCQDAGGISRYAREIGVSPGEISHILSGKRKLTKRIGEAMGFRLVWAWDDATAPSPPG